MYDDDDLHSDMSSSERVPMVLMEPFLMKGHILFTDNYYTSPLLAKHFLNNRTHICGTIKKNRKGFAKDIVDENLEKGTAVFYKCSEEKMIALKYIAIKDKANKKQKVVYLLSMTHQPVMHQVDTYNPDGNPVFKPQAIKPYNKHMGGVDMVDQQLHNLHTFRKTYKWYRKLAVRLISQSLLNAHKVYQAHTEDTAPFLDFLHYSIALLVTQALPDPVWKIQDDTHARLTGRHFVAIRKAEPGAKDQRPTKECRVCRAAGRQPIKAVS